MGSDNHDPAVNYEHATDRLYLIAGLVAMFGHRELKRWPCIERFLHIQDCPPIGLGYVRVVARLPRRHSQAPTGRDLYLLHIPEGQKQDAMANRIAEAVTAAMAVAAEAPRDDSCLALPITADGVTSQGYIRRDSLPRWLWDTELPHCALLSACGLPGPTMDFTWQLAESLLNAPTLLEAAHLYGESILHAWVADDDVFEFASEGNDLPATASDRQRVNMAYQNAFKALEAAICGEPPKDKARLCQRLRDKGLNPEERVGYDLHAMHPGKQPLGDKVADMMANWDRITAHGGLRSSKQVIGYCELKDKQALTRHVVWTLAHPPFVAWTSHPKGSS